MKYRKTRAKIIPHNSVCTIPTTSFEVTLGIKNLQEKTRYPLKGSSGKEQNLTVTAVCPYTTLFLFLYSSERKEHGRDKKTTPARRLDFIEAKNRETRSISRPLSRRKKRFDIWRKDSPKTGARMDDPVTRGLLPDPFLHQRFLAAEQLHGKFVVCRLEQGL